MEDNEIALIEAYKHVFSTPQGDLILNDLMINSNFYDAKGLDLDKVLYNEGKRSVILHIIQNMNMNFGRLKEIIAEDAKIAQDY